jgi:hypothetical protein
VDATRPPRQHDEHRLRHILGEVRITKLLRRQRINQPRISLDDLFEGVLVARFREALEQFLVGEFTHVSDKRYGRGSFGQKNIVDFTSSVMAERSEAL